MALHAAFAGTPLGAFTAPRDGQLRAKKCRAPSVTATLSERVRQRARDDTAKLQEFAAGAGRTAAACAAAVLLASSVAGPSLAYVPSSPPAKLFFDDAGVVRKGDEALFTTAVDNIQKNQGYTVRFVMAKSLPYNQTPDEYAKELFSDWKLGPKDALFVASPKLARAGAFVGDSIAERLTKSIAESICNETYALKSGDELYGSALLDVSNRLIPVLSGREDPGPPDLTSKEVMQTYKTKTETSAERQKYIIVVGAVLVIAFVAPLVQTYWYVKDD